MSKLPEPDDIEFLVGGVEPDARISSETARYIEEYKKRPEYPFEAEEAERILAALGINARAYGMEDAKSLLEHWHRCVADLHEADSRENQGKCADQEDLEVGSGLPSEPRNRSGDAT